MNQSDLPEFLQPPLIETAIGVQFEPIAQLPLFFGNFIDQRADVVRVETKPPLEPVIERVGGKGADSKRAIEVLDHPPHPRYWLFGNDSSELLQLQHDRIVWNWRKDDLGAEYPRFEKIFRAFSDRYTAFTEYARKHSLPEFKINQCEITYVNRIVAAEGIFETHADSRNVFSCWSALDMEGLPEFESDQFTARHLLTNSDGSFMGRLHVVVEPAYVKAVPAFAFKLIARGRPATSAISSLSHFFEIGHSAIVKAFKAYTTPLMHKHWEIVE